MRPLLFACAGVLPAIAAHAQADVSWMRYPAISPDGRTIVFTFKGDLYRVASSGGTATPLTTHVAHDFRPVWSHDGRQIAFASDRFGNFDVSGIGRERCTDCRRQQQFQRRCER